MTQKSTRGPDGNGEGTAPGDASPPRSDARSQPLAPGLYLVATPIGNARDITLRALDVLAGADALAAEDTRETLKLMEIHGIARAGRPVVAYHDRNGPAQRPRIMGWLAEGKSVAFCSDAGTPLVADPGYRLAESAIAEGYAVTALPGASAVLAGLTLSGLPTDRFLFAGFLPPKSAARRRMLADLAQTPATLVFFESPQRTPATLADMAEVLGRERPAALARELTKRFETVRRDTLGALAEALAAEGPPRGEVVLVVGRAEGAEEVSAETLDEALRTAIETMSVKDAARETAARLGLPRRDVYARALEIAGAR